MTQPADRPPASSFRLGAHVVHPRAREIAGPDGLCHVSPSAMDFLVLLAASPGEFVPADTVRAQVWADAQRPDQDIDDTVSELRWALADDPDQPRWIDGAPGSGYRLLTAPQPVESSSGSVLTADEGSRLGGMLKDLRRRHVFRVGAAYSIAAWLVIQVADVLFDALDAPGYAMRLTVMALAAGLPIAVSLAWAYQLTPQGLRLDTGTGEASARKGLPPGFFAIAGVGAAMVGGLAYWWMAEPQDLVREPTRAIPVNPSSIAVLPFAEPGLSPEEAYLGDGLAEELQQMFARKGGLSVASRRSSWQFRETDLPTSDVASQLGVAFVLEGSVRMDADRLRVFVELVDGRTGYGVWSESYEQSASEIFAVQRAIARNVLNELGVSLSADAEQSLARAPTDNLDAYDRYLRALAELRSATDLAELASAEASMQAAIRSDPSFAQPYAALCELRLRRFDRTRAPGDYEAAGEACFQALSRDAQAEEVYIALGNLFLRSGETERALERFDEVLEVNPRLVEAHLGRAEALAARGDSEAAEATFLRARELEPAFVPAGRDLAYFYFGEARYADAAAVYRELLELVPNDGLALGNLGSAYYMLGEFEQAADAIRRSTEITPDAFNYLNLGSTYYYLGRFEESIEMYQKAIALSPEDFLTWGSLGDAYASLGGRPEEARAAYTRAIELGEALLAVNPNHVEALAALAAYKAHLGEHADAGNMLARALELAPDDYYNHYYAALVKLAAGDEPGALRSIEQAVKLGFPVHLLAAEPMLGSLRSDQRFTRLAAGEPD